MAVRYKISVMESERGWGREYWNEVFDTYEEAAKRIHDINKENTSPTAPDWYMQASEKIEAIEEKA